MESVEKRWEFAEKRMKFAVLGRKRIKTGGFSSKKSLRRVMPRVGFAKIPQREARMDTVEQSGVGGELELIDGLMREGRYVTAYKRFCVVAPEGLEKVEGVRE